MKYPRENMTPVNANDDLCQEKECAMTIWRDKLSIYPLLDILY